MRIDGIDPPTPIDGEFKAFVSLASRILEGTNSAFQEGRFPSRKFLCRRNRREHFALPVGKGETISRAFAFHAFSNALLIGSLSATRVDEERIRAKCGRLSRHQSTSVERMHLATPLVVSSIELENANSRGDLIRRVGSEGRPTRRDTMRR